MASIAPATWQAIKKEYCGQGIGVRPLSRKYKVSPGTISTRAKKEHWVIGENQKIKEQVKQSIEQLEQSENGYALLETNCHRMLQIIAQRLTDPECTERASDVKAYVSAMKDIKDILGYKNGMEYEEVQARIDKLKKDTATLEAQSVVIKIEGAEDYAD